MKDLLSKEEIAEITKKEIISELLTKGLIYIGNIRTSDYLEAYNKHYHTDYYLEEATGDIWRKADDFFEYQKELLRNNPDLKVTEIARIDLQENQTVTANNIERIVELPLVEAVRDLDSKDIQTLMSSCNAMNVSWIDEDGKNKWLEQYVRSDQFTFGNGYAYIMINYDDLSDENKHVVQELFENLNDTQEGKVQNGTYEGNKTVVVGYNPGILAPLFGGQLSYKDAKINKSVCHEEIAKTNDEFFKEHADMVYTSTQKPRIVILRYPVDKQTKVSDATNFFNKICQQFVPQKSNRIKIISKMEQPAPHTL